MGKKKNIAEDIEQTNQDSNQEVQNETQEEIEALTKQIENQNQQISQLKDAQLRLFAEYDNYKKRTSREKDNIMFDATGDCLSKILPVMDSLKMAVLAKTEDTAYKSGIELVLKSFDAALEKMNVKPLDALNKEFDPLFHNAVMHVQDDSYGANVVIEVLLDGYIMGDKVIRHAMVKVAN